MPSVVVSDNGTHFTADWVQSWLKSINARQIFTPPRHPQSNGLTEHFVKSLKTAVRTVTPTTYDGLERCIDRFLLFYRNARHVANRCWQALTGVDNRVCDGVVINRLGSNVFNVLDLEDGSVHRRHQDQLIRLGIGEDRCRYRWVPCRWGTDPSIPGSTGGGRRPKFRSWGSYYSRFDRAADQSTSKTTSLSCPFKMKEVLGIKYHHLSLYLYALF